MNALTLLHEEHVQVKKLLEEGEATTERGVKTRTELYARLKVMLTTHERMEEEVLYPALKPASQGARASRWRATRSTTSST